jgi:ferredoxin
MKIIVTDQDGAVHELEGLDGWRVMEVIRDWGLNIKAECGGSCTCATCHVWVDEEWFNKLPPRGDLSVLFAPTGPIQEVGVSSGWGEAFLELAERFDRAAGRAYR